MLLYLVFWSLKNVNWDYSLKLIVESKANDLWERSAVTSSQQETEKWAFFVLLYMISKQYSYDKTNSQNRLFGIFDFPSKREGFITWMKNIFVLKFT